MLFVDFILNRKYGNDPDVTFYIQEFIKLLTNRVLNIKRENDTFIAQIELYELELLIDRLLEKQRNKCVEAYHGAQFISKASCYSSIENASIHVVK